MNDGSAVIEKYLLTGRKREVVRAINTTVRKVWGTVVVEEVMLRVTGGYLEGPWTG
ncbi:MAG: hypothetical protein M3461_14470 [Pseudomonadota bacterium]|nr:hypothetical protein [Pseudomonadota bacterium]